MERYQEIERSIIKRFRKEIWCKYTKEIRYYKKKENKDQENG